MGIKEKGKEVLSGIIRTSYSLFSDAFFGSSDYKRMQELYQKQVEQGIELSGEVGKLSHQLKQRNLEVIALNTKQAELETRQKELEASITDVVQCGSEILVLARELKTAEQAMKARANANASANNALAEWQQAYASPLEKRLKLAEQEAVALRSAAFSTAVDITLKGDFKIGKMPFAYYNFVSHGICYTPATLDFFGFGEERDTLTLRQLIGCIRKEDRRRIAKSLESGKGLKHYKTSTSGENNKELILTTKPFFYDKKPIGVAIFLFDPGYSITAIKDHLVYRRLTHLFRQMYGEFKALRERIKEGKLEAGF